LARNSHDVRLWGHNPEHITELQRNRENRRFLPACPFPANLTAWSDLAAAIGNVDLILVVVPSHAYGQTLAHIRGCELGQAGFAWATKGLEYGTGRFLHQVTAEVMGTTRPIAMVSGPSFAREVAAGLPTAITVASENAGHARRVASLLHGPSMRAYTSADIVGVEVGGAVKNVLAIAAGVSDGLGFGANARAALITRGLAEMVRLGEAVGGDRNTFMGLTGVGDLVLTCTDDQSRNRRFGLGIGQGCSSSEAQAAIGQVVEGVAAARELMRLARKHRVEMPITEQIDGILHHGQLPRRAVETLLAREPKSEFS
jgi:glycerol-3-phosphate dehydrogenase (NAD(P)+)